MTGNDSTELQLAGPAAAAAATDPAPPQPGPTLLPGAIAQAVSLATRSTSLAIRLGSAVSTYGLDAARFTTLSSLELARGLVEVVLTRAGKDAGARSQNPLAAADAETVLEKSLESLHYAVIQAVFWTSAGFRLTGATISLASEASQVVLASLDQILGSTDSSRAVASIITLMRREFQNPITGSKGEKIGVTDLVLAMSALAYLQQACSKSPEEERRRQSYEEVIWDVVVLSDGERVDVDQEMALQRGYRDMKDTALEVNTLQPSGEDEIVLSRLKNQIVASLPPDTTVSISNAVSTIQTITVDVDGPDIPTLPTPPGAEIVETTIRSPKSKKRSWLSYGQEEDTGSSYRVVYRIEREKFRSMVFEGDDLETGSVVGEVLDNEQDSKRLMQYDATSGTFAPVTASSSQIQQQQQHIPQLKIEHPTQSTDSSTQPTVYERLSPKPKPAHTVALGEPAANQKKQRSPPEASRLQNGIEKIPVADNSSVRKPLTKKKTDTASMGRSSDKKLGLKRVIKDSSQSLSNMWNKDSTDESSSSSKPKSQWKAARVIAPTASTPTEKLNLKPLPSRPQRISERSLANKRSAPTPDPLLRSASRASYISVQDRRRNSVVSQTDTYAVHPGGGYRPTTPGVRRPDIGSSHDNAVWSRAEAAYGPHITNSPRKGHRRHSSHAPSIYSLATNDSQASLVLASYYKKSAYSAADALDTLRSEGFVDGTFPAGHLLPNIVRYMRFSSACYGSHFMKFLGISSDMPTVSSWDTTHHDVRHFAHHTESDAGNILLASFVDPQGGTDATGATGTNVPLVHYISLDHEAKAVVLACRGTLGFEDVMTDMTCEFDNLVWKGRSYEVHKGMHASARRLLYGGDGRVLFTLKAALQEFPDYGLVLCGHSLGAGVTSLLGLMLSEPNRNGSGFVTATESMYTKMITDRGVFVNGNFSDVRVPAGRRIHVYAYGPPGVMCASLRKITRGLITSVIHGNDLVPHLSLGLLHDFQALALAFKSKENRTKTEIKARLWAAFQNNVSGVNRIPNNDEDVWMVPALEALRETMTNPKLLPPGEVFTIETQRVLRRDAFVRLNEPHLGRPAQRVVLKYIRDVEGRFGEVRFGTSMLTDHSPANYESALNKLKLGVVE